MLPWLMERGEVTVAEAAERFDLTEAEVVRDLELAAMCGLPPFVDELIDVFVDDGVIVVGVPRLFTRPLRLNSRRGLRAAGRRPGRDGAARRRRRPARSAAASPSSPPRSARTTPPVCGSSSTAPPMADRLADSGDRVRGARDRVLERVA